MIRFLIYLTGILTGLALAVAWGGRMSHLRTYAPELEPHWASSVSDDAGFMSGKMQRLLPGLGLPLEISWKFQRMNSGGMTWRVQAQGTGLTSEADVTLHYTPGSAALAAGSGEIDIAKLPALPPGADVGGVVVLEQASADFNYNEGTVGTVNAMLSWQGARLDGQDLGLGEVQIVSDASGGWRAPFSLTGDVITAEGRAEGRFGVSSVSFEITIQDAGAMPEAWKQSLNRLASQGENGWTLRRDIDLRAAGGLF